MKARRRRAVSSIQSAKAASKAVGPFVGLQEDYKALIKRPDKDGYQQFLVNLISASLGKGACSSVKMEFVARDSLEVCVLTCSPSPQPVYVKDAQSDKFYLRTGNATQELGTKDSVEYIKSRWV